MERKNEIPEELKSLQSPLADMPRSMPFEIPQGYFEALPADMLAALQGGEKPADSSDSMPYSLPEHYFDSLPQEILARAKQAETEKPKGRRISLIFLRAAAAAMLLAIGIAGYRYFSAQEPTATQQLATISDEDISLYLETQLEDMDTDLLAGRLSSADMAELEHIGNEEIIHYLNETGWDTVITN
jgi:hypothetical protein